eukprot:5359299-Pleurochrysis_carterae.AAC.1
MKRGWGCSKLHLSKVAARRGEKATVVSMRAAFPSGHADSDDPAVCADDGPHWSHHVAGALRSANSSGSPEASPASRPHHAGEHQRPVPHFADDGGSARARVELVTPTAASSGSGADRSGSQQRSADSAAHCSLSIRCTLSA